MKLSKNFSLAEMTKSQTATRRGIRNEPSTAHIENLIHLAETVLQPVRDHFANRSLYLQAIVAQSCAKLSGLRQVTACQGEAADFEIPGVDNKELAMWISKNTEFDQLILEFYDEEIQLGWVHCSAVTEGPRKQVLRASKVEGGPNTKI